MDSILFVILGLLCVLLTLRLNLEERGWGVLLVAGACACFLAALIFALAPPAP